MMPMEKFRSALDEFASTLIDSKSDITALANARHRVLNAYWTAYQQAEMLRSEELVSLSAQATAEDWQHAKWALIALQKETPTHTASLLPAGRGGLMPYLCTLALVGVKVLYTIASAQKEQP